MTTEDDAPKLTVDELGAVIDILDRDDVQDHLRGLDYEDTREKLRSFWTRARRKQDVVLAEKNLLREEVSAFEDEGPEIGRVMMEVIPPELRERYANYPKEERAMRLAGIGVMGAFVSLMHARQVLVQRVQAVQIKYVDQNGAEVVLNLSMNEREPPKQA